MTSLPIIYFITHYGYIAILIGAFFEGESILIIGGLAVHQGLLELPLVMLCSLSGTLASDNMFFFLGRFRGHDLAARYKFFAKLTHLSGKMADKSAPFLAFAMRFMYGFRHLVPFSLGMSNIKTKTFMLFNFIGGLTWVVGIGLAGYFFAGVLEIFFGHLRRYEFRAVVIVIILVTVGSVVYKIFRYGLKGFLKN